MFVKPTHKALLMLRPRSRTFTAAITASLALSLPSTFARAQTSQQAGTRVPPALSVKQAIDSAQVLNRVAAWDATVRLLNSPSLKSATRDERCTMSVSSLIARTRLGAYEYGKNMLANFDSTCVNTAASKDDALHAIRRELALPPLPQSGVDFSSLDKFWPIADKLSKDIEPSEDEWRTMMTTAGYRLSMKQMPSTRTDMEIALKLSRRAQFDSITAKPSDRGATLTHFRTVVSNRAMLARCRDSIANAVPIPTAINLASKFLPPHGTEKIAPPFVGFTYFVDDAYSLGPEGVIIDLQHICAAGGLTELLAHEFHHSYLSELTTIVLPSEDQPDATIVWALMAMRNEGIADLIDKPYPVSFPNSPSMARYAARYNEAYARTPQVVHSIDSALVIAAIDSTKLEAVGQRIRELLPSGGHFNGSYLAREIYETFGVDSLFPGVANQFAFLRTYASAEQKRGNPNPWSAQALALFARLETKYRKN